MTDIAGLIAGLASGGGMGNKFLANVRECDAIMHVVRCFEGTAEYGTRNECVATSADRYQEWIQARPRCPMRTRSRPSRPRRRCKMDCIVKRIAVAVVLLMLLGAAGWVTPTVMLAPRGA